MKVAGLDLLWNLLLLLVVLASASQRREDLGSDGEQRTHSVTDREPTEATALTTTEEPPTATALTPVSTTQTLTTASTTASVPQSPSVTPTPLSTSTPQTPGHTFSSQPAGPSLDGTPSALSTEPPLASLPTVSAPTAQQRSQSIAGPPHQETPSQLNVGDEDLKGSGHRPNSLDPLLAGLLSVFIVTTAVVFVVLFLKFRHQNSNPEFHRLQDLPMDDLMEDTPLSRYTY